ncbi:MAG: PhoH family protein [Spirochaetes bacterium]|nr:PhoH family protein [Spirochaetota bacterium]
MSISGKIRYLTECYKAESNTSVISDIFSKKIENPFFFNKEELLTSKKKHLYTDSVTTEKIARNSYLYRKEKSVYYGTAFIAGIKTCENGENQKICAPLFLYDAQVTDEKIKVSGKERDVQKITVSISSVTVNYGIILMLLNNDNKKAAVIYDTLSRMISNELNTFNTDAIEYFADAAAEEKFLINRELITLYPVLSNSQTLKDIFGKMKPDEFSLVNCSCVFLAKKSDSMRGVVEELETISSQKTVSTALQAFISGKKFKIKTKKRHSYSIPVTLSSSQEKILQSASVNPLTVVIGPPGTGKSFTIAAMAIDHYCRGESVLIVSKMDQAVDVVHHKITSMSGCSKIAVRGGDNEYLRNLKKYIQNILNNIAPTKSEDKVLEYNILTLSDQIKQCEKEILKVEKRYHNLVEKEIKAGRFFEKWEKNFIRHSLFNRIKFRLLLKYTEKKPFLYRFIEEEENLIQHKNLIISKYIENISLLDINYSLENGRKDIVLFNKGIRARTDFRQQNLFDSIDFSSILRLFPIWLVNTRDIYNVLPLQKELFDLAIIDEGSQCDIASIIPVLQRVKRVVIAGDPHQLKHISFLSRIEQERFAKEASLSARETETLNYREKSSVDAAIDAVSGSRNIYFLDEHYRSLSPIIKFSNNEFYSHAIKIMTEKPVNLKSAISVIPCSGKREKTGINKAECDNIISYISMLIATQRKFPVNSCQSIGILSPFRAQTDYIYGKLVKTFSIDQLKRHDLLAGTAHTFQGEERDIMLVSLCADDSSHINTFMFMSRPEILNVSITRARGSQIVYSSFNEKLLAPDILIRKYIEYIKEYTLAIPEPSVMTDFFQQEVTDFLNKYSIKTYPDYEIAGLKLDIVLEYRGKIAGIDLIGYPGKHQESFPLDRYKMYQRAGFEILPLEFSKWFFYKSSCTERILNFINYDFSREGFKDEQK